MVDRQMSDDSDINFLYHYAMAQAETQHAMVRDRFRQSNHFQPEDQPNWSDLFNNSDLQDWFNDIDATLVSIYNALREILFAYSHIKAQEPHFHLASDGAGPLQSNTLFSPVGPTSTEAYTAAVPPTQTVFSAVYQDDQAFRVSPDFITMTPMAFGFIEGSNLAPNLIPGPSPDASSSSATSSSASKTLTVSSTSINTNHILEAYCAIHIQAEVREVTRRLCGAKHYQEAVKHQRGYDVLKPRFSLPNPGSLDAPSNGPDWGQPATHLTNQLFLAAVVEEVKNLPVRYSETVFLFISLRNLVSRAALEIEIAMPIFSPLPRHILARLGRSSRSSRRSS